MADVAVELCKLLLKKADVPVKPPGWLLVLSLIATVRFRADHSNDLPRTAHELTEVPSLQLRQGQAGSLMFRCLAATAPSGVLQGQNAELDVSP